MENLKALVYGRKLNDYQKVLAQSEFEKLEEENKKFHKQLQNGRDYLMQLEDINVSTIVSDILEVFGFGRNGLS